jgi:hypothetical protein
MTAVQRKSSAAAHLPRIEDCRMVPPLIFVRRDPTVNGVIHKINQIVQNVVAARGRLMLLDYDQGKEARIRMAAM